MYGAFAYKTIPLSSIILDDRNPRIVTQTTLASQDAILEYLFEHEDLLRFIKKIAAEGKHKGAERPYIVKTGSVYTVIEGNSRIAAYKVLTGLLVPPKKYASAIPSLSTSAKKQLLTVDCSIAPDRDALLATVANAHFGQGDKSKWGYLGSRKAVYDEWKLGKDIPQLADVFDRTEGQIRELIIEYILYIRAIQLPWSREDKEKLLSPSVQFNPPVRFLQTKGHKEKVGIAYDTANLDVKFTDKDASKKLKHLIFKLVIKPTRGLGATATYDQVFADYDQPKSSASESANTQGRHSTEHQGTAGTESATSGTEQGTASAANSGSKPNNLKPNALFSYPVTMNNGVVVQLMKEAGDINSKALPASATFLMRNLLEAMLKEIISQQKANPASKALDLEGALNLCRSNSVTLPPEDKKVLKELASNHLNYLNLGAHGNVIPTFDRIMMVRGCVDQFVKRNV